MVPEGWEEHRFGDIVTIANGQVDPKEEPYASMWHVGPENIQSGTGKLSGVRTAEECGVISGKYEFDANAIVYSKVRPNLNKAAIPGYAGICSADMYPLWGVEGAASTSFLLHMMLSDRFVAATTAVSLRTGMPKINRPDLSAIRVTLPPLPEQRKIADILSTWDRAIETTEALLETARKQKRALMQQLLTGKRRFPEFEGQPWKEVRLGDLGKCIRGVSYKPDQVQSVETDQTMRLYRSTNIQGGEVVEAPFVLVPRSIVTKERVLKDGDLAVCMSNGSKALVGKSAPISSSDDSHTVGAFCAIFRSLRRELQDFVRFLFQSPTFDRHIFLALAGSSINNLKNSDIEGMRFLVPSTSDEMIKIARVLNESDNEAISFSAQVDKLRTEKKALMQQLLTGKRRVMV